MAYRQVLRALTLGVVAAAAMQAAQAAECTGNCGVSGADGVVTLPPSGNEYSWVSTRGGIAGVGQLAGYGGTNGSTLVSDAFFAAAGSRIEFWFNYVTSDGSGFADYAWSQLTGAKTITLFTARTRPEGTIVPGFELPGVTAALTPESVPINPGGPSWTPLGNWSGACYDSGCGHTGWVKSSFVVDTAGTYQLAFGVTNYLDQIYDSGMAFNGLVVNGDTVGDGSSATKPLLPTDIRDNGTFIFDIKPQPAVRVFIDPAYATGYDYAITNGNNTITSALFPVLAGDSDGYQVYALGDTTAGGLLGTVLGGEVFTFAGQGVTGFSLRGIDAAAAVDPANPTGFVTGLTFANGNAVSIAQSPVAVPEPGVWLMMALGGALLAKRRRQQR